MKRVAKLLPVALVLCLIGGARGEEKNGRPIDEDFLIKVATCNNAEIEFGKLAEKRAGSAKVKDFASQVVEEHKAAYDKLAELLKNRKVGVVAGLENDTRQEVKRLGKLAGAEFDRAFMQRIIQDHKRAIALFEGQVANGKEADIRVYAKNTLPELRRHLKMAHELDKEVSK